ncbi:MAG TPA: DUF4240 domain-containing protein [Actinospica sp.]|nr:DUF4240 domain-containing protein [Actinospica sp.]
MDRDGFWELIDRARLRAGGDAEGTVAAAGEMLAGLAAEEIIAAQQVLWDQLAASYVAPLWAAAYLINGGCSDDGFDYFRGWLVVQGREVFERAVGHPDWLAEYSAVREAAGEWEELECESTLGIAYGAYRRVTGESIPQGSWSIRYPALGGEYWFDFSDSERLHRMLPRLAALYGKPAAA